MMLYLTDPFTLRSVSVQYGAITCMNIGKVCGVNAVNGLSKLMSPLLLTCGLTLNNTIHINISHKGTDVSSGDSEVS